MTKKSKRKTSRRMRPENENDIQNVIANFIDPDKLTTPRRLNADILKFCKTVSDQDPFFLNIQPEPWSRQSCCNLNVEEYIRLNNGNIVCGYKIWYNQPNYIETERHAIWSDGKIFKDITFNPDGETRILFLPDYKQLQSSFKTNWQKIRWGKNDLALKVIQILEETDKRIIYQETSDKDQWNRMLTYESWQKGNRMANYEVKKIKGNRII